MNDTSSAQIYAVGRQSERIQTGSDDGQAEVAGSPLLLTIAEASQRLRVSKWMVYRLIHTRQLKTVTIGRRRFVPADSLRRFVEQLSYGEDA
jgi:excisionase family DNA binding protein